MAKVAFTKITPIREIEDKIITINGMEVSVKQYLPIQEKADIIDSMLADVFDDNYIASPVRLQIYFYLAIIIKYTNIGLTEKMLANPAKTYDLLSMNGIFDEVIKAIPEDEFNDTFDLITETVEKISNYYQSFLGVLKVTSSDYKNTDMDVEKVMNELRSSPNELKLVQDVLTKMQ